jgi:hypothetical protein
LTRDEFAAVLHSQFEFVGSLLQRPMLGSALLPSQDTPGAGPPITFEQRGDDHFERSDGLSRGVYIVAVASHVPVKLPTASLYIETSGVGLRVHETAEIRAANDAFREEAGALRSHNEQQEALLRTARADNERLEGLFASARSEAERLEALFQSAQAENARLEALLADARREQARLGGIIESKEAENASWLSLLTENEARLHASMLELTELRSDNARLVAELSDAQSVTIGMRDEREATSIRLEQIAMRLRTIENSISWRIISPVRRVVHRLLRVPEA